MHKPINQMEILIIRTEIQHKWALLRLEELFDSKKGSKDADDLELLALVIDKYENEKYPIAFPDPIEAIKFRMDQLGYKQKDLAKALGRKSGISEMLNKKRKLTLSVVRKLNSVLGIPTDVLIQEY